MIQRIPWKHCKIYREIHGSLVQYDIEFKHLFRCGFIRIYRTIPKERSMVWKRFLREMRGDSKSRKIVKSSIWLTKQLENRTQKKLLIQI